MKLDHITAAKIAALGARIALTDAIRSLERGRVALDKLAKVLP